MGKTSVIFIKLITLLKHLKNKKKEIGTQRPKTQRQIISTTKEAQIIFNKSYFRSVWKENRQEANPEPTFERKVPEEAIELLIKRFLVG